jgi:hypothetical protein
MSFSRVSAIMIDIFLFRAEIEEQERLMRSWLVDHSVAYTDFPL